MTEKKPPYDHDDLIKNKELSILASIYKATETHPSDIDEIFSKLEAKHFHYPTNKLTYIAMKQLQQENGVIDRISLQTHLKEKKVKKPVSFILELDKYEEPISIVKIYIPTIIDEYNVRKFTEILKTNKFDTTEDINRLYLDVKDTLLNSPTIKQSVRKKDLRSIDHIEDRKSKNSNNKNKITTGFDLLDEAFYFSSGELNTIQARSSHGKTSFMLSLVYKILKTNNACSCIFVTYESSVSNIRTKILNTISTYEEKRQVIKEHYDKNDKKWKEDYADESAYAFKIHDDYINEGRLSLQEHIPLENLENLIKEQRELTPNNTIILFLDYIQIIGHNIKSDGWEKIKLLATKLEEIAVKENVIIMIGSQVNDKGDTREGRDIYFSSSNVIDLFNHSHPKVKNIAQPLPNKEYWEPIDGHIVSISMEKSRNFEPKSFNKRFRFDGFKFWEADYPESYDNAIEKISKKKELSKVDKEFQIK